VGEEEIGEDLSEDPDLGEDGDSVVDISGGEDVSGSEEGDEGTSGGGSPDDVEEGDDLPGELQSFFESNVDEEGKLPPGADEMFARVVSSAEADSREASYAANPRPRVDDYKPLVRNLAPRNVEEPDFFDHVEGMVKKGANNGIRAMNSILGTNMEEMEQIRSLQDSELIEMGAFLLPIGAGVGIGLAGMPVYAALAVGGGVSLLHSTVSSYDDPDKLEKYDSVVFDLLGWEGFIGDDIDEASRWEKGFRIWLADSVDILTGGAVGKLIAKGGRAAYKGVKGMDETGAIMIKLADGTDEAGRNILREQAEGLGYDPRKMTAVGDEEARIMAATTDEQLEAYTKGLADRASTDQALLEALGKMKKAREALDIDPARVNQFVTRTQMLRNTVKGMVKFDEYPVPKGDKGHALAMNRAWGAVEKDTSVDGLKRYMAHLHGTLDEMKVEAGRTGVEAASPVLDETVQELLRRRKFLTEKIFDSKFKTFDAPLDRALKAAKEYTTLMAEAQLLRQGVKVRAHEALGATLSQASELEHALERTYAKRFLPGGLSPSDEAVLKKTQKAWSKLYDKLLTEKDGWLSVTGQYAMRAHYDNMLSNMALAIAGVSGLFSMVSETAYHYGRNITAAARGRRSWAGVSRELLRSFPRRTLGNVAARMKDMAGKEGRKELKGIWLGTKLPRRYDKYGYQRAYVSDQWWEKGLNIATGTARMPLHMADELLTAFHEGIAQVGAMERIIMDTALPAARPGQVVSLKDKQRSVARLARVLEEAKKNPEKVLRDNPNFISNYMSEVDFRADANLLRANPEDYPDAGMFGSLGLKIYKHATRTFHYSSNTGMQLTGTVLMPFPRVWANMMMAVDHFTPVGAIRRNPLQAMKSSRRIFGTGVFLSTVAADRHVPGFRVIDSSTDEDSFRKWGGRSGVEIGGRFFRWDALGPVGIGMGAMYRFHNILELTPGTGEAMNALGLGEDMSAESPGGRASKAFLELSRHISDDSFFERGMTTVLYGMLSGSPGIVENYAKEVASSMTSPGKGFVERVATGVRGARLPRSEPAMAGTVEAVKEFAEAVAGLDTVEPWRDMLGVPMSAGEDRDGTRASVDFMDRLIFIINPLKRGETPKSTETRDFMLASGALKSDDVLVGNKRIPGRMFRTLFGFKPVKINSPMRSSSWRTYRYPLSPREYNDKITMMSMDWDAIEKVLDRYALHYDTRQTVEGMESEDRHAAEVMENARRFLSWRGMKDTIRMYYGGADSSTRLSDVLHRLGTGDVSDQTPMVRDSFRLFANAMILQGTEARRLNSDLSDITDDEIREMAERHARVTIMNNFYRMAGQMASAVMRYSPGMDELKRGYYSPGEEE